MKQATKAISLDDLSVTRLSPKNFAAVMAQCPGARYVGGFHDWLKCGRVVMKGQHGYRILAPLGVSRKDRGGDTEETKRFKVVYVFELSQTAERGAVSQAEPTAAAQPAQVIYTGPALWMGR